ncbi:MAG: hypothetical protein UR26_C0001G0131 [candidate division TM6 bacterium GW2011_GWF2_32_72]|nr:MAG: hypothetical protein UR26_C0001G0131 [candidate division TM6 bacterium GW2011_GWF2_32_72]
MNTKKYYIILGVLLCLSLLKNYHQSQVSISKPKIITILSKPKQQNGPQVVTDSLIRGLKKLNIPFNLNPEINSDIGDTVITQNSLHTLHQMIKQKRNGQIKKLIVGPNTALKSFEALKAPEIDLYLVPCQWVKDGIVKKYPELESKIKVWPSSINLDNNPSPNLNKEKLALIYWKTEGKEFCDRVKDVLEKNGWKTNIIKYGHYKLNDYLNLLNKCSIAVFLSGSESQGLALAESWSKNVPTLVWDKSTIITFNEIEFKTSSCPYLTESTGKQWQSLDELEDILKNLNLKQFSPRKWLEENLSDEASTQQLINLIKN